MTLPVAFLTDYGYEDQFAGACRLVIERLAPGTTVIDVTHGVPAGDVRRGALALEAAAGRAGPAVYLAVVDPGVGTDRRGVAVKAGDSFLVGPDNGLLSLAGAVLGGVDEAVDISATPLALEPVTATFHGRDVFAPVAAHLASGHPLGAAGEETDPGTVETIVLPSPLVADGRATVHVLYADHFGNLILDARPGDLDFESGAVITVTGPDGKLTATRGRTFADAAGDGLVLYETAYGRLAIAANHASAADALGAGRDDLLSLWREDA